MHAMTIHLCFLLGLRILSWLSKLQSVWELQLGKVLIETFPDGEIGVQILENVRGRDVFVLQSIARHPNHYLMELLILVDALKRASARSIIAVIPYFGYARQDRKRQGESADHSKARRRSAGKSRGDTSADDGFARRANPRLF